MSIRIWNERNKGYYCGVGAQAVISHLATHGIHATCGEAEFANHEGIFVEENMKRKAMHIIDLKFGRPD